MMRNKITMRISILIPFIIGVVCSLSFLGCNPKKTDNPGSSDLNKNEQSISNKETNVEQETKVLFFEQQFGPYENQRASYTLTFKGNKMDISYKYSIAEPIIEHGELKEGKIVTEGCTDCYLLSEDRLCVPNPETGESDCYGFIRSKSTHSIQDVINPEIEGYFKGQKLEPGEKIIKVNWAMENKTNFTNDYDKDKDRFSSKTMRVPNGKIWILLYLDERYIFESGSNLYIVPNLFINNVKMEWKYRRKFSKKNNINISKAKIENVTFYPNESIIAISDRQKGKGYGEDFIDYNGEMWFLETTNTNEMEQLRMRNVLKNLR